tara:strand:+ start:57516 stop:57860 length:345 start_codon:yes stop_codon:yes gene_type:complete
MKKFNTTKALTLLVIVLLLFSGLFLLSNKSKSDASLYTEVFIVGNGYGYKIVNAKDRILIKQDFIPAVQGEYPFKTKNDAKLVAELVKKRLLKVKSPVISINDLSNLKIKTYNE